MVTMDFEKQAMQARLDLAERQLLEAIERLNQLDKPSLIRDIELHIVLATVTGKPNKYIPF
ncbi:hypothetical protein [Bacillus cereus]|uniref:Uncharacterized protein n=1 Tax=Bacillus cereus TaxID=1396 RepID=A0A1Q4L0A8_BACCE|nr:hypothetical protein [Bacillus cereus]OKA30440.1 hypothetical protein BJR07_30135 [Bacillus cereus]OKA35549.1 hypothetical protein BJR06_16510 [Bacillus cereus]